LACTSLSALSRTINTTYCAAVNGHSSGLSTAASCLFEGVHTLASSIEYSHASSASASSSCPRNHTNMFSCSQSRNATTTINRPYVSKELAVAGTPPRWGSPQSCKARVNMNAIFYVPAALAQNIRSTGKPVETGEPFGPYRYSLALKLTLQRSQKSLSSPAFWLGPLRKDVVHPAERPTTAS